jgi:tetratricopeptide (TPR) repeat protein
MIKVPTLRICGFVSALIALAACSGSPPPESPAAARPPAPANGDAKQPARQTPQGQQPDRRQFLEQALTNARRSMELRLFEDARNEAAFALELDNQNQEARDILQRCNEILGDRPATVSARIDDMVLRDVIAAERERFNVQRERDQGNALMEQGAYGRAVDHFERALAMMRFSIHFSATDPLRQELEGRLKQAQEAKVQADKSRLEREKAAGAQELERMAREEKISQELLVRGLFDNANLEFQRGNYREAVASIDKALLHDPTNEQLLTLRDLADRARHTVDKELHRERWKQDWSTTFDELRRANLPQTETVKFDPARWAVVSQRKPLAYSSADDSELPETREIIRHLEETRLEHIFASATVKDWAAYYGNVTGVTFIVTPEVRDLDAASTTLTDFKLPRMSVAQALKVIQSQTGVAWKVKDGMVLLVKPENAIGTLISARIPVGDLVQGVKNKPGPDLKLRAPGDDTPTFPEEEGDAPPSVVDDGRLRTLITTTIQPTKWEGTFSINYQSGVLFVRADAATLEQVNALLTDLRRHVGIQVDVEARFLKVEDNFLEDLGVDLRGLGNQASQGLAGRGLEQNNRAGVGFDDFGQTQQINPATPGLIGTGSEPGVFYDDGKDGDFIGRVENLYDRTLGGQNGGLNNAGGLSLQYAFLDDTELEVVLRAVSKQERSEEINNPRLLINNNTRASMSFLRNVSYIRDFEVEIAQAAAVANPVIGVVHDGVALDVRPVVDADLRFITMELRPTVMSLQLPIPTFTTTLGVGQPISIQLPSVTLQRVRTIVTMPDGGTMMLGGMKLVEKMNLTSGVPLLKDVPGLSFLFSRKGTSVLNRKILILIRAKIILMSEHEPNAVTTADGTVLMTAR